jgi:8-amino-7-oxononanoate synthase
MFSEELENLKQTGLFRYIKDRNAGKTSNKIIVGGIEYINFSSNDYLGLSGNGLLIKAAKDAMDKYGLGSGASRLLSGGTDLHSELERRVAEFKGTESALVFNSGYTANISVIPAIAGEGDIIFSDELNHASIIDGCRLSKAKTIIYRHRDAAHLSELMQKEDGNKKIVITDTVFSMDGDIAPLKEIYELCRKHNAMLYLDDAHGTGALGNGRGALAHFGIAPAPSPDPLIIQMGTFSKALGSCGAFVAANKEIIEWLVNAARGFIYSTALPSCVIAASLAALKLIQKDGSLIKTLQQNRERLFNGIKNSGFDAMQSETPIIPVIVGDTERALRFSDTLKSKRIYAPAIRPPTVKTPRIRLTVTAAHTDEDIERLLEALKHFASGNLL